MERIRAGQEQLVSLTDIIVSTLAGDIGCLIIFVTKVSQNLDFSHFLYEDIVFTVIHKWKLKLLLTYLPKN